MRGAIPQFELNVLFMLFNKYANFSKIIKKQEMLTDHVVC